MSFANVRASHKTNDSRARGHSRLNAADTIFDDNTCYWIDLHSGGSVQEDIGVRLAALDLRRAKHVRTKNVPQVQQLETEREPLRGRRRGDALRNLFERLNVSTGALNQLQVATEPGQRSVLNSRKTWLLKAGAQ